jgi:hypothetical protein
VPREVGLASPLLALDPLVNGVRHLYGGFVPMGVEQLGRRHFPKPVEAVQSIACHGVNT